MLLAGGRLLESEWGHRSRLLGLSVSESGQVSATSEWRRCGLREWGGSKHRAEGRIVRQRMVVVGRALLKRVEDLLLVGLNPTLLARVWERRGAVAVVCRQCHGRIFRRLVGMRLSRIGLFASGNGSHLVVFRTGSMVLHFFNGCCEMIHDVGS